jgi:single stranded DNA-binding protein
MVIGHLGQDPAIRYTPTGLPVVYFSVATDEVYRDKEGRRQERAEWHRIVVIGKLAMTCNEFVKKGREVFVEGPAAHARVGEQRLERSTHRDRREPNPTDDSALPADSEIPF